MAHAPTPDSTLTSQVVQFICTTPWEAVPTAVRQEAKRCWLDGLAVMVAGSTEPCSLILQRYLQGLGTPGRSTVIGTSMTTHAELAALANGVSGHALDYDDTQLASHPSRVYGLLTHPTVPVLAAALALGQELAANGQAVLHAFCIGFEVECKLAETIHPRHYQQGFHSTGTFGTFGAAAVGAVLLGLNPEQTRMALGIAASKASGIRANFGTMTKPYHAGAAAQNGLIAARLASLGFTADPNALDGPWGYFQVAGGGADPQFLTGKLGSPWAILDPGVSVKPYPCGSLLHPAMDTLRDLVLEHDLRPQQVAKIRLGTTSNVLSALRYARPQNALQAKFSIPFMLGILVLRRQAGLQEFRDEVVQSREVQDFLSKVEAYLDPELEALGFARIRARVEVHLNDGRILSRMAEVSRGTPQRPLSHRDLMEKFQDCARGVLPPQQVEAVAQKVDSVETLADINTLMALLHPRT
ncbi:MAG: MmgE/PrpD family protein [Dehalococcoidia bacterium]|nr:MmgE/PrpD family protein [Dehalococcoidia bacterium]MDW8119165.1 MmgE/PrpD family protein [Chloroflexota bacterium]